MYFFNSLFEGNVSPTLMRISIHEIYLCAVISSSSFFPVLKTLYPVGSYVCIYVCITLLYSMFVNNIIIFDNSHCCFSFHRNCMDQTGHPLLLQLFQGFLRPLSNITDSHAACRTYFLSSRPRRKEKIY